MPFMDKTDLPVPIVHAGSCDPGTAHFASNITWHDTIRPNRILSSAKYLVTVSFNLPQGGALGTAVTAIQTTMNRIGMPACIHGQFAGAAKQVHDRFFVAS
jgi:hypothetical protein